MLILHGVWLGWDETKRQPGRFVFWAETDSPKYSLNRRRIQRKSRRNPAISIYPSSFPIMDLRQRLFHSSNFQTRLNSFVMYMPSLQEQVIQDDVWGTNMNLGISMNPESVEWKKWELEGVSLKLEDAIQFLIYEIKKHEDVLLSEELIWFQHVIQFTFELIIHERYVPNERGTWETVLDAQSSEQLGQLAAAMPTICNAVIDPKAHFEFEEIPTYEAEKDWAKGFVDACVDRL